MAAAGLSLERGAASRGCGGRRTIRGGAGARTAAGAASARGARGATIAAALVASLAFATLGEARAQSAAPTETDARRDAALIDALTGATARAVDGVGRLETGAGHALGYAVAIEPGLAFTALGALADLGAAEGLRVRGRAGTATALVLARNEGFGVALLRVGPGRDGQPILHPAPLGAPGAPGASTGGATPRLAPGSLVAAVGLDRRPLAAGVISALGRRVEASAPASASDPFGLLAEHRGPERDLARAIQHDAPLAADMRGSALVDARGDLVGVNLGSAYRGTSFAIGIDDLLHILPEMREGRPGPDRPAAGWLGVVVRPVAPDRREALGLPGLGAEVGRVIEGGPAEAAGLRAGDVLRSLDGQPLEHPEALPRALAGKPPGTKVRVVVLRDGKNTGFDVTLVVRPTE